MNKEAFVHGFMDEMEKEGVAFLAAIPWALRAAQMARAASTAIKATRVGASLAKGISTGSNLLGRASGALGYGKGGLGKVNLLSDASDILRAKLQRSRPSGPPESGTIVTP